MDFWCEKHKTAVYDFCDRCVMEKAEAEFHRRLDAMSPFRAMASTPRHICNCKPLGPLANHAPGCPNGVC